MTPFSVYAQDSDPSNSPSLSVPRTSGQAFRRPPQLEMVRQPLSVAVQEPVEELLPSVVLQLPDLAAMRATPAVAPTQPVAEQVSSRLAAQLYWIGIVLGALLAAALIWTGEKPAPPTMDEAPAWRPQEAAANTTAVPAASAAVPVTNEAPVAMPSPQQSQQLQPPLQQEIVTAPALQPQAEPAPQYAPQYAPQPGAAPQPVEGETSAVSRGEIRTARGTPVQPGEARPLGITPTVIR